MNWKYPVKKLLPETVAFCGLPCDTCPIWDSNLPKLATQLEEILSSESWKKLCIGLSKMEKHFVPFQDYEKVLKFLQLLEEMECRHPCKEGGGSSDCRIRKCCKDRHIEGCWMCDDCESCENLDWPYPVNGDAPRINIQKIRKAKEDMSDVIKLKWFE